MDESRLNKKVLRDLSDESKTRICWLEKKTSPATCRHSLLQLLHSHLSCHFRCILNAYDTPWTHTIPKALKRDALDEYILDEFHLSETLTECWLLTFPAWTLAPHTHMQPPRHFFDVMKEYLVPVKNIEWEVGTKMAFFIRTFSERMSLHFN